ncbi:hypothetical protein FRC10_010381 [Ceratobasidium sp. 414]|nr:hypothetical protein FRC10_010381 [Ceratobasidium sp. 414]
MTILQLLATASLLLLSTPHTLAQLKIDDSYVYSASSPDGIQYSKGQWNDKNSWYASQRYNGTYHNAEQPGAHFAFFFRGSSIKYYADRDPKGGPITISLDGADVAKIDGKPPNTTFQFQQQLWSTAALDSGDHCMVVTGVSGTVGLDWLEVVPVDGKTDVRPAQLGPGALEVPPNAMVVDDSDISSITWSGSGWQNSGDSGPATYFQNAMHKTTNPGDSATFKFNGTAVWYFTDMMSGNAAVLITVDGGQGEEVQTAPSGGASGRTQKLTWSKAGLSNAGHTVNVRHAGSAGSPAGVDFFMYMPGSSSISSNGSPPSNPLTPTKTIPVGAIVGGVVAAVIALAAITLFVCLLARNRRERLEQEHQRMHQGYSRPGYPAQESFVKEGWSPPPPPPSSGLGHTTPTSAGGSSGYSEWIFLSSGVDAVNSWICFVANFPPMGYVGYGHPEVQRY